MSVTGRVARVRRYFRLTRRAPQLRLWGRYGERINRPSHVPTREQRREPPRGFLASRDDDGSHGDLDRGFHFCPYLHDVLVRAREAVLRDHLFTLHSLIDRFTLDNGRAPARLEELVEGGYLGRIPTDPFTGSNETWQEEKEDAPLSPKQTALGIVDVHSGSDQVSLEGTPYSGW